MTQRQEQLAELEAAIEAQRPRLVRLCGCLTGSADTAEDLAQETLVEAWRNHDKVYDPAGYAPWLSAIARNVCLRWSARQQRGIAAASVRSRFDPSELPSDGVEPEDPYDFELELERGELAELLDRALALLPADTRTVLVKRYIEESPHAEIAAALRMSEGAVKVKVHRGKLALRRLLATDLREEASVYGLLPEVVERDQQTRIWCPVCGAQRLMARHDEQRGCTDLRCPACCTAPDICIYGGVASGARRGSKGLQAAVTRQTNDIGDYFRRALATRESVCGMCGRTAMVRCRPPDGGLVSYQDTCYFLAECAVCGIHARISFRCSRKLCPRCRRSGGSTRACIRCRHAPSSSRRRMPF